MKQPKEFVSLISQLPVEMKLLLEFVNTNIDKNKIDNYKKKDINWEKFYQLALHHRVIPLLYYNLNRIKPIWIPSLVMDNLQTKYRENVFLMLQLTSQMESIAKLFNENNIEALFLKGPTLGKELYGDISLRTSKDLDILISSRDIKRTQKLLLENGYKEKGESGFILNEHKWRTHHTVFYHPNSKFSTEIHWRLNDRPDIEPSFNCLWERRRVTNLTKEPISILGEEDLFLYLVSHGARHGWFRIRWLVDIERFLQRGVEWERLNPIIKEYSNEHVVGQSLLLANHLLNTPTNKEFSSLLSYKVNKLASFAMIFIKSIEYDQSFPKELIPLHRKYSWKLQKNILQKIKFFMVSSYPSYKDYQVFRLPKSLHFLYFFLRPFLYTGRKLGVLKINENG